ncbi:biopolymer transporter ExbD [uncultured Maritimibacter sp.]|jgi:biopolymer transport protein ExbD|uniref:biopolymer transporter ExbD n=1 Tax=uncultured Maritimibacter sp. TaxID=991866 RepID=UPI000B1AD922|nr:biopolymer transporter ExbD [uncultured Maritimibacter sp.]
MRIGTNRPPRTPAENVIPMINVVFLLLVFFLITARIAPPLPVEIEAPTAEGAGFETSPDVMVVAADGTPYFGGAQGDEVWPLLTAQDGGRLTLRVDRNLDGARFAALLKQVSGATGGAVDLVVEN